MLSIAALLRQGIWSQPPGRVRDATFHVRLGGSCLSVFITLTHRSPFMSDSPLVRGAV